ncbi:MAG: pyridoxal phosphate-dependent aminotransferase [Muribaculaceae bacterium]|nr:pyridoxal phosphate-dependent aminotransferase [Bacteroidales bacterium]MDY2734208.1 pyridoxal phosphate-dependent aminotransferase [Muribaculaceae bacterium]
MNLISKRINNLSTSATLAMLQKSNELRAAGVDIIGMSAGEPDFDTPTHIKEAGQRAIAENYSRYTAVAGYESLRRAICDKLRRENGLDYEPTQIVVGNGAKQELANALLAVVDPGDEVLIPTPAWVSYVEMVKLAEGVAVTIEATAEHDYKITAEQLEQAITPRSKVLMLNSPCNPTGSVYSETELEALAEVLRRHPEIIILSDEIYEHINFRGGVKSFATLEGMKERTILINGVSKAYAMTGWRIGYMAAPAAIAKAVTKLQGQYTSGASSIAQKAAEAAYNGDQTCVEEMRKAFERRSRLIYQLATEIPGWRCNQPEGAFYLLPDVKALIGKKVGEKVITSSGDYVMYLLEEAHVACVDGAAFCADGHIRLSYATSDDNIREAMKRIREATEKLS